MADGAQPEERFDLSGTWEATPPRFEARQVPWPEDEDAVGTMREVARWVAEGRLSVSIGLDVESGAAYMRGAAYMLTWLLDDGSVRARSGDVIVRRVGWPHRRSLPQVMSLSEFRASYRPHTEGQA